MVTDLSFDVAKRDRRPVTFTLQGDAHEYSFTPPKNVVAAFAFLDGGSELEVARGTFEWLDAGLSDDDQDRIEKRLKDPEDDLDIDNLSEVVEKLQEYISGRPTT